jgi:hypothetical protein
VCPRTKTATTSGDGRDRIPLENRLFRRERLIGVLRGSSIWWTLGGPSERATVDSVTAKEKLRNLVEELSEEEAASALIVVERRRADPMLQALAAAPADNEESTPEEDAAAREALADYQHGESLRPDELKRDLGLA